MHELTRENLYMIPKKIVSLHRSILFFALLWSRLLLNTCLIAGYNVSLPAQRRALRSERCDLPSSALPWPKQQHGWLIVFAGISSKLLFCVQMQSNERRCTFRNMSDYHEYMMVWIEMYHKSSVVSLPGN